MKQNFETLKDAERYADGLLNEAKIQGKKLIAEAKRKGEEAILAAKTNKTEKDPKDKAKKFAKDLLQEAEKEEKKLKEEAKLKGAAAIQETKEKKAQAKTRDKELDAKIATLISDADQSKIKGDSSELLPRIYEAINFGAKVADRGWTHVLRNPKDTLKAVILARDIKKMLEKELGVSSLEGQTNAILQSNLVQGLLRDPKLWQVIELESAKLPRILANFRELIGKEVKEIIETPSTISTLSKLHIVKEILRNQHAVNALTQVAVQNQEAFARLLTDSQTTQDLLKKYGIDASNIQDILPAIIDIVKTLPQNHKTVLELVELVEPIILGQTKTLDTEKIMPLIADLIKNGVGQSISGLLKDNKDSLLQLASNKALQKPLEELGLDQSKALEVADKMLPLFAEVLGKQDDLAKLVRKLPQAMDEKSGVNKMQEFIPDVQALFTGEQGMLSNAVETIAAQKENIASLAVGVVKQNTAVQAGLRKALKIESGEQVNVSQQFVENILDLTTNVLSAENLKQLNSVLGQLNKPDLSNAEVGKLVAQVLPLLSSDEVVKHIDTLLPPLLAKIPAVNDFDQEKVMAVAKEFLPVVAKVLKNRDGLTPLAEKLPAAMSNPIDINKVLQLIPDIQSLLIGENGALGAAIQAVAKQKDNIAPLIATAIQNNNALQYSLLTALGKDYEGMEMHRLFGEKPSVTVDVPQTLLSGLLDMGTQILDKSNHDQLGVVLNQLQKIQVDKETNKPVLSNEEVGEIAKNIVPLLTNAGTIHSLRSLLTPENIQFLRNIPALKDYAIPENQDLIIETSQRLLASSKPVQNFLQDHYAIVNKILKGRDNLENGVFEDTDLTPDEVVIGAKTALQVVQQVNPAELLTKHKARIAELMTPALTVQFGAVLIGDQTMPLTQENAKKMGKVVTLARELAPILVDTGALLLKTTNLQEMEKLAENLAPILDETTPIKEKLKKASEIGDFFAQQIKSPEFKKLYGEQVIPFLKGNREEVSQLLTDLPKHIPALHKFKIKGKEIVNILADSKTTDKLESAYDAYKDGSYLKALGNVVQASIGSKDLRSVVAGLAIDATSESLYPNFLRRWLVGSRVNAFINKCKLETPDTKLDLGEKFHEQSQEGNGIFSYTLRSQVCKGLDFGKLEFSNMNIDGFDFRQASFGSKQATNFSGSTFKNVNFTESNLRGNTIDLSNATFDLASFKSILPQLDKALKDGKAIKTEGMKINISNASAKDLDALEKLKKTDFGKVYLDPTNTKTSSKERVKYIIKESVEVAETPRSPNYQKALEKKRSEMSIQK